MTDDTSNSLHHSSRSKWSILLSLWMLLAILGTLFFIAIVLENQVLERESTAVHRLAAHGYRAAYEDGWFRRFLPREWRPKTRVLGDRAYALFIDVPREPGSESLMNVVADLQELRSLREIHIHIPGGGLESGQVSKGDIVEGLNYLNEASELPALAKVNTVRKVYLTNLPAGVEAKETIRGLQTLTINHFILLTSVIEDSDLAELARLPSLKVVEFFRCTISIKGIAEFKRSRPDVTVTER